MIRVTNTLSGEKEEFKPLEPGKVRMYVCGPTVYGLTHIGNARPAVFFNVVRNFLELSGFDVTYVSNFTDVDDKIINRAREEKIPAAELAEGFVNEFVKDMESLGVRKPDKAPKVTEFIPQIVQFIEGLVKKEAAYVTDDGEVFFAVRKFKDYGKLSKKNIDDLRVGARVDPNEKKKDPLDFSLWKPQKAEDEPAWDSPWGKGRPGWHIECSAMSMQYCGESFDIHGGGMDLIHPHHENEIAQSEGLTDKLFVKYWMHNNMLTMGSEKMSKSLGNIFLTRDFIQNYSAETLKFMLLSGHYRSTISFSEKNIRDVECGLHRIYSAIQKCERVGKDKGSKASDGSAEEEKLEKLGDKFADLWKTAMEDDFNTAKSFGYLFDYVRAVNAYLDRNKFKPSEKSQKLVGKFLDDVKAFSAVMNILGEDSSAFLGALRTRQLKVQGITEQDILLQIEQRTAARKAKDFAKADSIRDELLSKGVELRDAGNETTWDVVFTAS